MTKKFFIVCTVLFGISVVFAGVNKATAVAASGDDPDYGYESAQPFDHGDADMQNGPGAFPEGEEADLPFLDDMPTIDPEEDTAGFPVEK